MLQEGGLIASPADLENQGARQLARKIDPSGDRVIRTFLIHPSGFSYLMFSTKLFSQSRIGFLLERSIPGSFFSVINMSSTSMGGIV